VSGNTAAGEAPAIPTSAIPTPVIPTPAIPTTVISICFTDFRSTMDQHFAGLCSAIRTDLAPQTRRRDVSATVHFASLYGPTRWCTRGVVVNFERGERSGVWVRSPQPGSEAERKKNAPLLQT